MTTLGAEQEGAPFDPRVHEAIMRQPPPPGTPEDAVLRVLRPGYVVGGDQLVRPALVVVAQE